MGGNMKTILSRRYFPPLPIVIDYNCQRDDVKSKDMGRMLAALKRPDRIRFQERLPSWTNFLMPINVPFPHWRLSNLAAFTAITT
jgi:hypothetical protein